MKRKIKLLILILITNYLYPFSINNQEARSLRRKGQIIKRNDTSKYFSKSITPIKAQLINTDPNNLQQAARYTLKILNRTKSKYYSQPYLFNKMVVNINKVKETLRFIIALIENDKKYKRKQRILCPSFLNKYFNFIKWSGDQVQALKSGKKIQPQNIYLTHYATFQANGSYTQTKKYPYALYEIINKYFDQDLRFKISKQNVLTGRLNKKIYKNKVKPLVWLSRENLEEALMQGTIIIKMPNGKQRTFTVTKNNGFAFNKNIKKRNDQKRYWYFKEIINGDNNIINYGNSVFAGDIYNIGLGKIIAIRFKNQQTNKIEIRLGVLADSGGAFINNLYQLDFYGGIFKNHNNFYKWVSPMPKNVQAYILVKK